LLSGAPQVYASHVGIFLLMWRARMSCIFTFNPSNLFSLENKPLVAMMQLQEARDLPQ